MEGGRRIFSLFLIEAGGLLRATRHIILKMVDALFTNIGLIIFPNRGNGEPKRRWEQKRSN